MPVLYFFESIRAPFLDAIMSMITHIGEETFILVLAVVIFWCIDKKEGYYLLSVGFIGTIINQFLKITCRISRPWVKDPSFTIVESARAQATGYSFPSGHTQSAAGVFSGMANWHRKKALSIICYALIAAVAISRMYLGVHTPYDVGVSLVIALALSFGLYPIFKKGSEKALWSVWLTMAAASLAFVLYVNFFPFPTDIEAENLASALKNSYTIFGASTGVIVAYYLDSRFIRFETKAPLWAQFIKCALGLSILLLEKALLKAPLNALLGASFGQAARYFIIVFTAGFVWPYFFRFFKAEK